MAQGRVQESSEQGIGLRAVELHQRHERGLGEGGSVSHASRLGGRDAVVGEALRHQPERHRVAAQQGLARVQARGGVARARQRDEGGIGLAVLDQALECGARLGAHAIEPHAVIVVAGGRAQSAQLRLDLARAGIRIAVPRTLPIASLGRGHRRGRDLVRRPRDALARHLGLGGAPPLGPARARTRANRKHRCHPGSSQPCGFHVGEVRTADTMVPNPLTQCRRDPRHTPATVFRAHRGHHRRILGRGSTHP